MITPDQRWSLPRGNTPVPSRWQATPSLVRIVTTTPPTSGFSIGPGQNRAGPSAAEHQGAAASKVRSQSRSHLTILVRHQVLGSRTPRWCAIQPRVCKAAREGWRHKVTSRGSGRCQRHPLTKTSPERAILQTACPDAALWLLTWPYALNGDLHGQRRPLYVRARGGQDA
jgi:hypothetical protein